MVQLNIHCDNVIAGRQTCHRMLKLYSELYIYSYGVPVRKPEGSKPHGGPGRGG
jgi:hypothetical protein